jgi:hypothetical protein
MSTQPNADGQTGIRVTASFMPLAWILFLLKPHMGVNGSDVVGAWKQPMFFPTPPGQHTVMAYFPYFIPKQAGKGTITVNVAPGQVVDVTYRAPWIVFLPGKMKAS